MSRLIEFYSESLSTKYFLNTWCWVMVLASKRGFYAFSQFFWVGKLDGQNRTSYIYGSGNTQHFIFASTNVCIKNILKQARRLYCTLSQTCKDTTSLFELVQTLLISVAVVRSLQEQILIFKGIELHRFILHAWIGQGLLLQYAQKLLPEYFLLASVASFTCTEDYILVKKTLESSWVL